MKWRGVESPVLVLLHGEGSRCDLVVFVYRPADDTWAQLGGNLAKNPGNGEPEAPRIAVYQDVPFITWAERDRTTGRRHVYVRRYNEKTGKVGPPGRPLGSAPHR